MYLSPEQRSTHRHVIGKTGSGKTMSVLWPSVLQDALDGKGVLFMSGKGSDEELRTMKAIAKLAKRESELRVFSLPAWNVPELFTHTYNMVYVRPRTATSRGGDPVAMAQRVFSVLPIVTIHSDMDAEAVDDVKRAKSCDCGHSLTWHAADGAGHCRLCDCPGSPLEEEPDAVADAVAAEVLPLEP